MWNMWATWSYTKTAIKKNRKNKVFLLTQCLLPLGICISPLVYASLLCVKLWFSNMYFVGFYSVPNLIVILFNLMYSVFVVGIYCKGCVIVRESVKTQAIEARRVFVGISRLNISRKDACALHMTRMRRVSTDGDSCVSRVPRG